MNRQQTVLIVDDEKSNRDRLTELLQPDCRIILAKNGQQALERVADQTPDLILLDVMMPDMDGHQVIQILKHDDNTRKIPVIFISALDSPAASNTGTAASRAEISCFFIFSTSSSAFPIILDTSSNWGSADASYSPIRAPLRRTVIRSLIS